MGGLTTMRSRRDGVVDDLLTISSGAAETRRAAVDAARAVRSKLNSMLGELRGSDEKREERESYASGD